MHHLKRWFYKWLPAKHDTLTIESAPLHTESDVWAAQAPAQMEASFKRGALFIGFTEMKTATKAVFNTLCDKYGYSAVYGTGDTAIAVKNTLKVLESDGFVPVIGPHYGNHGYSSVKVAFGDSEVTFIYCHWATNHSGTTVRQAQTDAVIAALQAASAGQSLAFYAGDANPSSSLTNTTSYPRMDLDAAGFPLVYETLDDFPDKIGVNVIGYAESDVRVTPTSVETIDALGSDHIPALATFDVKRRLRTRIKVRRRTKR